jgi:hypothetical protein
LLRLPSSAAHSPSNGGASRPSGESAGVRNPVVRTAARVNLHPMLPTNEIGALTMTVTNALDFAAEGKVADGYAWLVWGLRRTNFSAHYSPPRTPPARRPSAALQW